MNPLLDQVFALVPDALVLVDGEGRIVQANPQADRLFGYSEGELAGLSIEQLMPEDARHRHRAHRTAYMAQPRVRPMGAGGQALVGQRRDGTSFPLEIALSPIAGEPRHFLASVRDVSETQRARQQLQRAHYDRLVARVGERALAVEDEDEFLAALPSEIAQVLGVEGAALFAFPAEAGRARVLGSFGVDERVAALAGVGAAAFGHDVSAGRPAVLAELAPDADGALAVALATSGCRSALLVPLLERQHVVGVALAVSARAHAFDSDTLHCLQSIANVASALMQRRRAEDHLAHAQRIEALGQLTGGIAHDFNNLLTVMSGNLQLLELEGGLAPGAGELIANALRAVDHGAALTSKLLAFARRQRLSPRAVDPAGVLKDLGLMLRRTLGDNIIVEIRAEEGTSFLFADAAQLESALLNLALNARDAMPRGGRLTISAEDVDIGAEAEGELVAGRYVRFTVADTGLGMAPEVLARAFEPFFTTKGAGKGSGLGLSMAYGFVRQSGGQLRARSRLGYGTTMELLLPGSTQPPEATAAPAAMESVAEHVLVVEDEHAVRDIAVAFVRSLGHRVTAVSDAESALELLARSDDIDVLFTDVALGPGMNGIELATLAQATYPRLRVLLTSGHERAAMPSGGDLADRFDLLPKPYRREDLSTALKRR
jgi:PAS domain S-box-containing protein